MSLDAIFKAYDVRGIYPDEIDENVARRDRQRVRALHRRAARSSSVTTCGRRRSRSRTRSSRVRRSPAPTSPTSVCARPTSCYFASGRLDAPGAMFTASHNPAQYNGIKMCQAGAAPIGEQTGLAQIKEMVESGVTSRGEDAGQGRARRHARGLRRARALVRRHRRLCGRCKVVADTANGMGGLVVPTVFEGLPFDLTVLYGELDGTFPNHPADPIQPENLKDLQRTVLDLGADIGLAFDGDADRVFLVDDQGEPVSRFDDDRDRRRRHPRPAPRRDDRAQPDLLEGGARGHPRARRYPGAHARRSLVHQAGDGRDRRDLRRRALRALLLPRQLARRLRFDRRADGARAALPGRRAAVGAAQAVRALRAERRDQHAGRRSRRGDRTGRRPRTTSTRRTGSTASPSTAATGGSTCVRATPSRCSGSNLEAPDAAACDAHTDEVLALVRGTDACPTA